MSIFRSGWFAAVGQTGEANSTITQLGEGAPSGGEPEIERQNSKPFTPSQRVEKKSTKTQRSQPKHKHIYTFLEGGEEVNQNTNAFTSS